MEHYIATLLANGFLKHHMGVAQKQGGLYKLLDLQLPSKPQNAIFFLYNQCPKTQPTVYLET